MISATPTGGKLAQMVWAPIWLDERSQHRGVNWSLWNATLIPKGRVTLAKITSRH
jgi:hypothetical protein